MRPIGGFAPVPLLLGLFEQSEHPLCVTVQSMAGCSISQPALRCIMPCAVQQPIAKAGSLHLRVQQRFGHQTAEAGDDVDRREFGHLGDKNGILGVERATEHRQQAEQSGFPLRQEPEAPVDRCHQGFMTRRRTVDARGAKTQVLIEKRHQLARREPAELGCRQFNGQRKAVERVAYPGDRFAVVIDELIVRPLCGGRTNSCTPGNLMA